MKFNPILAAKRINNNYKDYIKSTFYIKDQDFRKEYIKEVDIYEFSKGPYLECVDAFEIGNSLSNLVNNNILSASFKKLFMYDQEQYERPLYLHQEKAIRTAIDDKNMIITTGTGSGKTECFLYPILNYLLNEESKNTLCPGVRVLLLYPMNALANDQMQRLRQILEKYPSITFGAYTGETKTSEHDARNNYYKLHDNREPLKNELISRKTMIENPPHILVTNYAMLEYLLLRPKENVFFDSIYSKYWKYIVLDEAHVYSGASGMEVSILMRRLLYRLSNNEKIRFILTSATLGDEKSNSKIIKFGNSLCADRIFENDSIIRAIRKPVSTSKEYSLNPLIYRKISDLIDNEELNEASLKKNILAAFDQYLGINIDYNKSDDIHKILFYVFSKDELYFQIRRYLFDGVLTATELADKININLQYIIYFINIASFAQKNKAKLLDAKYHHFIKTLEGAYISFYPKKTLSLVPKKTIINDNQESQCYKLSVCQFCGTVYIEGQIRKGKLEQVSGLAPSYFMVIENDYIKLPISIGSKEIVKKKKNFKSNVLKLCTICGRVTPYNSKKCCDCPKEAEQLLYKVKNDSEDKLVHKCQFCETVSPRNSILRGFYLGQDASTAVVCESLYNELPKRKMKNYKPKVSCLFDTEDNNEYLYSKRLLMFSDSRQDAAYFASYFQYTYDVFFKRRLMLKSVKELMEAYVEEFKKGIPLLSFIERMKSQFSKIENIEMLPDIIEKETWKTIISEFKDFSRNSLHSIGWMDLQIENKCLFPKDYEIAGIEFTQYQAQMISQLILDFCLKHGALELPDVVSMTNNDWAEFDFGAKEPFLSIYPQNTKKNVKSIIPKERNVISSFLEKVFNIDVNISKAIIKFFLEEYFCVLEILKPIKENPSLYKINPQKLIIKSQNIHKYNKYKCNVCGRITSININNKCPSYRCKGYLEKYEFEKNESKQYYLNQYSTNQNLDSLLIKEHTAQLSKESAQDYQQKFIDGKINILSCSTTFEMGVDVGNLESVFMKNIPPKPSNYIQRAGRAGRRLNSSAFSLTFCKLSPHDFYYFKNPSKMINGLISPPSFKIDNIKIVRRHIYAILLSKYWKELFPQANNISEFFENESYVKIQNYIKNLPKEVYEYINQVVPNTLSTEIDDIINNYIDEILKYSRVNYINEVAEFKTLIKAILNESASESKIKNSHISKLRWLQNMANTYEDERIISFYSKNNLIPKYGFPVDTVELKTDFSDTFFQSSASGLSLQRDLIQAISDYAPESEVIADGYVFKSRYIRKPMNLKNDWRQFVIEICNNKKCGKISEHLYTGEIDYSYNVCSQCGEKTLHKFLVLLPDSGFQIDPKIEKATTKKPKKTHRTQYYYLGEGFDEETIEVKDFKINQIIFSLVSSPNDKLLVMNKSDFLVCDYCGYSEVSTPGAFSKTLIHKNVKGIECKSKTLNKKSIGHKFNTDVLIIHINEKLYQEKAITLLYTFLEGLSIKFDIDRDDIDGCISYQNYLQNGANDGTTIILFDSVPGGAGNVKRLFNTSLIDFKDFLKISYDRVKNCKCGTEGNTVCYNCLSTYRNQYYQDMMQRKYAIDFLEKLI